MLQYLTGGAWGIAIRRELEAGDAHAPADRRSLFLPLAFGMHRLYEWTHADVVAGDELLQKKALYLNAPFFLVAHGRRVRGLDAARVLPRTGGRASRTRPPSIARSTASSSSSRAAASSSTPSR